MQIAAAFALGRLGDTERSVQHLSPLVTHENRIVGMYAIRAIELLGPEAYTQAVETLDAARNSNYEFTHRIAVRMMENLEAHP